MQRHLTVTETCEAKLAKAKIEQQAMCSRQVQTAEDQLKHEHLLNKRKAIEEALQLAQKRHQRYAEQVEAGQQRKHMERRQLRQQQRLQGNERQENVKQQPEHLQQRQLEPAAAEQQKQFAVQQPSEKEPPRPPQVREPQELPQDVIRRREPVVQVPQERLLRPQQNPEPKQFGEQPSQREAPQKLPVRRQRDVAQPRENEDQQPAAPLQQPVAPVQRKNVMRQSLQDRPDEQHPQPVPQEAVQEQPKIAGEPAPSARQSWHQAMNQEPQQPGPSNLLQRKLEQQKPLIYQVPAPPARLGSYKQVADDEQLAHRDVQAPQPEWKQQHIDVNRQRQFEQLQQDRLHEQRQGSLVFHCF